MALFVDTNVWSMAFRRDAPEGLPELHELERALLDGETVVTTGLVLQELLQGFKGPRSREMITERFAALSLVSPSQADHVQAAGIRNACRRRGVQVGTIDALLAQLCIRHDLTMLTLDRDFDGIARHTEFKVWRHGLR